MLSKLLEYHGKDVRLSHNITRDENLSFWMLEFYFKRGHIDFSVYPLYLKLFLNSSCTKTNSMLKSI